MTEVIPPALGFDGTINEPLWAAAVPDFAGADYGTIDGWALTPVAGAPRTVRLSAGSGFSWAVSHRSEETSLPLPEVSTATWFVIGWSISWESVGGTIKLDYRLTNSATTAALPVFNQRPGYQAFHPLWLVQVTPGQQLITASVDKRVYPAQTLACQSLDAIPASSARLGQLALRIPTKSLHRWNGSGWDDLVDRAPSWKTSYLSGPVSTGAIQPGQSLASGKWAFPTWKIPTGQTLGMQVVASRRLVFPSPGVYTIAVNIPCVTYTSEIALFKDARFVTSDGSVTSPYNGPVDTFPVEVRLKHQTMFLVHVRDAGSNYMLGFHNSSPGPLELWTTDSLLDIVKVADL